MNVKLTLVIIAVFVLVITTLVLAALSNHGGVPSTIKKDHNLLLNADISPYAAKLNKTDKYSALYDLYGPGGKLKSFITLMDDSSCEHGSFDPYEPGKAPAAADNEAYTVEYCTPRGIHIEMLIFTEDAPLIDLVYNATR